jgi:hypothetical protein
MFGIPLSFPNSFLGSGKYIIYDGDLEVKPLAKLRLQVLFIFRVAWSVRPSRSAPIRIDSSDIYIHIILTQRNATQHNPSFRFHLYLLILF